MARSRLRQSGKPCLTRADRLLAEAAYSAIASECARGRPKPRDVAAKLGPQVMARLPASSLRRVLRKFRPERHGRAQPARSAWTVDLPEHFETRSDRDGQSTYVAFRELGVLVTSFVVLVPPLFRELVKLRDAGIVTDVLVGAADTTFEVEFQGYTFNQLFFQVYHQIEGRWRKHHGLPLLCVTQESARRCTSASSKKCKKNFAGEGSRK